jgi:orotidine-5'-phosphate decarboxylase
LLFYEFGHTLFKHPFLNKKKQRSQTMTRPDIPPDILDQARKKIIFALDTQDLQKGRDLVQRLLPFIGCVKIGYEFDCAMTELFYPHVEDEVALRQFAEMRTFMRSLSGNICVDAKLNDIESQVRHAMHVARAYRARMITIHANAGIEVLRQAVQESYEETVSQKTLVLAVTLLSSADDSTTQRDFNRTAQAHVLQMAHNAVLAGADGIYCTAADLEFLNRFEELKGLVKVVDGVRPESFYTSHDGHRQVRGVKEAIRAGADYLVIGKPIAHAVGMVPEEAARRVAEEIGTVLMQKLGL